MARISVTEAADADIDEISEYLAVKAGFRTVAKYHALFDRLYLRLSEHPASGAPRPRIGRNIRIGVVSPYIVIYRYRRSSDTVAVLRVIDGRRPITSRLLRPNAQ